MKVFLDSNIYYSACLSDQGASAALLYLNCLGLIQVFISNEIIKEVETNLEENEDELKKQRFLQWQNTLQLYFVEIEKRKARIKFRSAIADEDDVFVLAVAEKAKVNYLVTLDRKHFFTTKVRKAIKAQIVTPGEMIEIIRSKL